MSAAAAARAEHVFSLLFGHVTRPVTDTSHTCHYRRRRRQVDGRPAATKDYAATTIGCKSNGGSSGL